MGLDFEEALLGSYRDKVALKLYASLSHSDFKGNYEDTYTIELLYSIMCLDLCINTKMGLEFKPEEIALLARNVIRLVDDGELSDYSIFNWSYALLSYMKEKNLTPKFIHKMSTVTLKEDVSYYLRGV